MLRSSSEQDIAEPVFSLKAILAGRFDDDLRSWCREAHSFGSPLIVEWGTEANGEWFSWNGAWNGGAKKTGYGDPTLADGPERFIDTYRHLVTICREQGADNVAWAWHVNADSLPQASWNALEAYWPGSDFVDIVAVSAYGAQQPTDEGSPRLRSLLDPAYPRLVALARAGGEPVVLAEFGVTDHNPHVDQADWARDALSDLVGGRWPALRGFSWWNEQWENDDNPSHNTTMRVQDNPELAAVFTELLGENPQVLGRLPDQVLR
jgi:beta-mannanase